MGPSWSATLCVGSAAALLPRPGGFRSPPMEPARNEAQPYGFLQASVQQPAPVPSPSPKPRTRSKYDPLCELLPAAPAPAAAAAAAAAPAVAAAPAPAARGAAAPAAAVSAAGRGRRRARSKYDPMDDLLEAAGALATFFHSLNAPSPSQRRPAAAARTSGPLKRSKSSGMLAGVMSGLAPPREHRMLAPAPGATGGEPGLLWAELCGQCMLRLPLPLVCGWPLWPVVTTPPSTPDLPADSPGLFCTFCT